MTRRKMDMRAESELADFMDDYFYPRFCKKKIALVNEKQILQINY